MVAREAISPNGNGVATEHLDHHEVHRAIDLHLTVQDPVLCGELLMRDEPERSEFALAAMRVGVAAIRQAQGQVDGGQIRDAGEQVIRDMTDALESHRRETAQQVADCIREYFDPQCGLFTQRVKGLVGHDDDAGELERIIRRQVDGDGSVLARTLAAHLSESSPLMSALNADSADGLVSRLAQATEDTRGSAQPAPQ